MRQFGTLFGYEMKKILCRKSTWISFGILVAFYILSEALIWGTSYSSSSSEVSSDGEIIEEDSYSETHAELIARQKKDAERWSGRKLDDAMLQEIREEQVELYQNENTTAREYSQVLDSYWLVGEAIRNITGSGSTDIIIVDEIDQLIQQGIYEQRQQQVLGKWKQYSLAEKEEAYWQKKEDAIAEPFTLQYSSSFENLVSTRGIYMALMLACFFIAITVSQVFAEEHARRTDQLILSSRLGRRQLYFAKILTGAVVAFAVALLLIAMVAAAGVMMYGAEGFSEMVQLEVGWYSYPLTMGQVAWIITGLALLASILTSIFAMVISEGFHSSLIAMAMVIGSMFAARLIQIPMEMRLLSQIWNFFPINLVYFYDGFVDLRLVSVFGIRLTNWQFAPILYVVVGGLFIWIGKKLYCNYQVQA